MSYTRPPQELADSTWQGEQPYTPPASGAADVSWASGVASDPATAHSAAKTPLGATAVRVVMPVVARAQTTSPLGLASATVDAAQPVDVRAAASSPLGLAASICLAVRVARSTSASPLGFVSARGHAVVVACSVAQSPLGAFLSRGMVLRYELRGIVRINGVLVDRRVRAYRRDTGDMVGEADTDAGAFAIHAGFEPREHVVMPIDMSESAADFAPPVANRVLSTLAQDTP